MLTLLTVTGMRPEVWAICEKLMLRQTYEGYARWIIVDDGVDRQPITFRRNKWMLTVVYPEHVWKDNMNTQIMNLKLGMKLVQPNDRLVIIEDDDCYHPNWLKKVNNWLNKHDLVGEASARYYNVVNKGAKKMGNMKHASLCSTAMKGKAIDFFRFKLQQQGQKFIDKDLWPEFQGSKQLYQSAMVVGMKGLPGRMGIGIGHHPEFLVNNGRHDVDRNILSNWVGPNTDLYAQY